MKRAIGYGLFVAVAVLTLAFLLLPIVGIFVHTSPGKVLGQLSNPVVTDALIVSLKTSLIAQALIVLFGTPTAYLLATRRFTGRAFVRKVLGPRGQRILRRYGFLPRTKPKG